MDGRREYNMDLQIIGPVHIIIIHLGNNYVQIRLDTTVSYIHIFDSLILQTLIIKMLADQVSATRE